MNALKTFLERAKDGGWDDGKWLLSPTGEDEVALGVVMNPEAAHAVWGEETVQYTTIEKDGVFFPDAPIPAWVHYQHQILTHIQSGKTPLEALELELN